VVRDWILVVDDDTDMLDSIVELLSDAGFSVVGARSGSDALEEVKCRITPCGLIVDYLMPQIDGLTLPRHLRGALHVNTPALMLTAMPKRSLPLEPNVPVLEKPCSGGDIISFAQHHFRSALDAASTPF
jgi:DNA-binding response OmpR family regulator